MASPLLTHQWTTSIKNDTGTAVVPGSTVTISGDSEFNEKISLTYGQTAEIDCGALAFADMVSLFMVCNGNVSVNTNASDGAGGQTILVSKNSAYAWNNTQPVANPITANITKIFVTWDDVNATNADKANADGSAKAVTFRCGILLSLLA